MSRSPLTQAVAALLPPGVALTSADPRAPASGLLPGEAAALARARPARRAEFAAGRRALRDAMAQLGLPPLPVPQGPDRAPLWPAGLVGALSHDDRHCLALLCRAGQPCRALGIDIEPDADLPEAVLETICLPQERDWLATRPLPERGRLARLIFSAKECAYKCQFTISGEMLDFTDLHILPEPETGRFQAIFMRRVPGFAEGAQMHGMFARAEGRLVTVIALH